VAVAGFDLSSDGQQVAYAATARGRDTAELRLRSLVDGTERVLGEALGYFGPRLSRDGSRVGYRVSVRRETVESFGAWVPVAGGEEHRTPSGTRNIWSWSPDGEALLTGCPPPARVGTICERSAMATDAADVRTILIDPDYDLWQPQYSPDGRWVVFNAQSLGNAGSIGGVMATTGGSWTPLTDPALWADKPRWGVDGRSIYFISNREGAFFNVWRLEFDPEAGRAVGEETRVTRYDDPGRIIEARANTELGVSADRLVVPIVESTGSIWMLDNIAP
jgi:Tol biopolymer transport system component